MTAEQREELIEYLQGTCNTMDDGIQTVLGEDFSEDDLTEEDEMYIRLEIFLCDTCGWWCEICEESEDDHDTCESCAEE